MDILPYGSRCSRKNSFDLVERSKTLHSEAQEGSINRGYGFVQGKLTLLDISKEEHENLMILIMSHLF